MIIHQTKPFQRLLQLHLFFFDPESKGEGQRIFTVSAGATQSTIDIFKQVGGAKKMLEQVYPVTINAPEELAVTLTPVKGKVVISGAVLEPTKP